MGILCDIYIYIHILQLEQLVEALLTLMIEVRPPVLKSPFQSDSLILLCNPDGTLSKAEKSRCRRSEHTSKRMQLQMPGRAASPLKQMTVSPVTYGSRWNPFPPANSGSPKPKSKGHWLVSPEIHWCLEGMWHVDRKIWWNSHSLKFFCFSFGNKSESGWWHRKVISQVSVASLDWFNHLILSLDFARSLNRASSSHNRYTPIFRVSRRKLASIDFVRASASWAPLCTHRTWIPSLVASLIALATKDTRNSEQEGGAVRLIKSNNDLHQLWPDHTVLELSVLRWLVQAWTTLLPVVATAHWDPSAMPKTIWAMLIGQELLPSRWSLRTGCWSPHAVFFGNPMTKD